MQTYNGLRADRFTNARNIREHTRFTINSARRLYRIAVRMSDGATCGRIFARGVKGYPECVEVIADWIANDAEYAEDRANFTCARPRAVTAYMRYVAKRSDFLAAT